MKRNWSRYFFQESILLWKYLLILLYPLSSYSDFSGINCSHNAVSGCVLEARLNTLMAEITTDLQTGKGEPIFIFANVNSDLKPQTETGPTNYSGDGKVILTLTNNSHHYINIYCSGTIYMKGSSGSNITNATRSLITSQSIVISGSNLPSGNGPQIITKDITNFSSSGMNLWQAALGTEPNEPLDCQLTFIVPTLSSNPMMHVYVPIPYV